MQTIRNPSIENEIKQPDGYSCLACCAAMITKETLQDIYDFVGHNGSDNDIGSKHPEKWEGFSNYDIYMYLANRGYTLGNSFKVVDSKAVNGSDVIKGEFSLKNTKAIITVKSGRFENVTHAIYWDGCRIYDPSPEVVSDMMKLSDYELLFVEMVERFPLVELSRWKKRHPNANHSTTIRN